MCLISGVRDPIALKMYPAIREDRSNALIRKIKLEALIMKYLERKGMQALPFLNLGKKVQLLNYHGNQKFYIFGMDCNKIKLKNVSKCIIY